MYRPNVKAGQIANLTDARYFSAWAVEWLGFSLEAGQGDAIAPAQALAIKEWVEGPKFVGEFSGLDVDLIHQLVKELELDAVEISRFGDLSALNLDIPVFVNIVVEAKMTQEELKSILEEKSTADYLILDFEKNSIPADSQLLEIAFLQTLVASVQPIFMKCNNALDLLPVLMEEVQPEGLAFVGGEEEKVGIKTFDELDDIFEAMEDARMIF